MEGRIGLHGAQALDRISGASPADCFLSLAMQLNSGARIPLPTRRVGRPRLGWQGRVME